MELVEQEIYNQEEMGLVMVREVVVVMLVVVLVVLVVMGKMVL
jgi:hypothetical protein